MRKRNLIIAIALMIGMVFAFNANVSIARDMTAKDIVAEAKKSVTAITVSQAKSLHGQSGVIFLDCREPKEYKAGHVPGAINIPRGLLEFKIGKKIPNKNQKIVFYCKKGGRGFLSAHNIKRMGYKKVSNMKGGWKAWTKKGYPVE